MRYRRTVFWLNMATTLALVSTGCASRGRQVSIQSPPGSVKTQIGLAEPNQPSGLGEAVSDESGVTHVTKPSEIRLVGDDTVEPSGSSDTTLVGTDQLEKSVASQTAPELAATEPVLVGFPLDLPTALQLATGQNPQVQLARERIAAAEAQFERAEVQWLPSLSVGPRWSRHDGQIQDTEGDVFNVSRSSLLVGGGARVQVQTSEAYFAPLAARQTVTARHYGEVATRNQTLLDVSLAYWELLRVSGTAAIQREATVHLTRLDNLADSYLRADKLKPADADRVRTELLGRKQDLQLAEQDIRVMSARLARLLHLDPSRCIRWNGHRCRSSLSAPSSLRAISLQPRS